MVAALAASAAVALAAATSPAAAHVCVTPVEVDVGEPATITVGIPAEARPVVRVDIEVPAGFDLAEARPARGWTLDREGSRVSYTDGEIPVMQCGYFTLTGTAERRAKLVFPVTAVDAAGETTVYGPDRLGAQEVYAGIEAFPEEDGGVDVTLVAGIVLVAGGALAAVVLALRRRRG